MAKKRLLNRGIGFLKNKSAVTQMKRDLSVLASKTDYEECYAYEKKLALDILSLSSVRRKENSEYLQPLHLYFAGLSTKGRISLDKTAENPSINLFTDLFLSNTDEIKSKFHSKSLQKVILMLIRANLSVHRMKHATMLLEAYYSIFSEFYKSRLYLVILTTSCGQLSLRYVEDLFSKAEETYNTGCKKLKTKVEYLHNLHVISRGANLEAPIVDDLIRDLFKRINGTVDIVYFSLLMELSYSSEFQEEIDAWLRSTKDIEIEADVQEHYQEFKKFHTMKKSGETEIPLGLDLLNNDSKEKSSEVLKHLNNRDFSRGRLLEEIDDAIKFYKGVSQNPREALNSKISANNNLYSLTLMRKTVSYWNDYNLNYLKVKPNGNQEDTIFVFTNEYSHVNGATSFPFFLEAKRRGIKCFSVSPTVQLEPCDEQDEFYDYTGWITGGKDCRYYKDNNISDVVLDIDNKKILVKGLNVYQPIFEFVSRYQFTYNFNYETDAWARYRTIMLIRIYKALFEYIEKVEDWAVRNHKKVYFVSNAPHIHNAAAFRIYCEERGYKNGLEYICTSPGYDNYFLNASDPRSETATAVNMTRHLECRNAFLGTKEGFETYYENNRFRMDEIRQKMKVHLEAQRGRNRQSTMTKEKQRILDLIKQAKADNKTILLLNGKVIIDLAVKYTKGCVHSDMSEWITHAVAFAKENSDKVLLLIKPHPHENRQDLTLTSEPIDTLKSLIRTELSETTIYLDNDMFTNSELVPYMDIGLVWNGTSALEFAAQGKKVLLADVWGHYDYPIGFVFPKTIEEYESYMLDPESMDERRDISDRAITFLEYMGSDDVRILNPYSQTTLMNFNQYESKIDPSAVDSFVAEGDKALSNYFSRLI